MELLSYVSECLKDDIIVRWPEAAMPITVYIAPCRWYKAKGSESYLYQQMVVDSLNLWQQASNGKVSFQIVNTINESQINVDWRRVDRQSLGHCLFSIDNLGRLFSAEVQIGLSDGLLHSKYQDKNEVMHTILHEIGHAIGLQHSPYQNDIMYVPHQYGIVTASPRDKLTLKWLYNFTFGMSSTEILSKYKLSSDYSLDHLVYTLETKDKPQLEKQNQQSDEDVQNLEAQQKLLANMNKYNIALQNIAVSPKVQEYIRKNQINSDNTK